MERYECKTAQPGFAAGKAWLLQRRADGARPQGSPAEEADRLEAAVREMSRKLTVEKEEGGAPDAALLEAERMILQDEAFLQEALREIREEGRSAPDAVDGAARKVCALLQGSGAAYIRERSEDVRGLAAGLNRLLAGGGTEMPGEPFILAAAELSPAELMMAGTPNLLGILTESGSPTSHVSVLAGNLGIPYLYGLERIADRVAAGDYLILDGESGFVTVNPPAEAVREAEARTEAAKKEKERLRADADSVRNRTLVCANISRAEEADGLAGAGADGIGLFRSEFLFLDRPDAPSEEEQFEAYRRAAEAMGSRKTTIRTMDIGSDKRAGWLRMPEEANPALGLRGIRVSLARRDLFRTQLRAILRAAVYGNVRIMIPMVASVWELDEALKEVRLAAEELEKTGTAFAVPEVGVMIETPAAVMMAPELARKARFFSIGTNDLTQYTLAVDREARGLESFADPLHDAVMRMIRLTAEAAHENGIRVSVCGELASDERAVEKLIRLGVDELSVSGSGIARVRRLLKGAEERLEKEEQKEREKQEEKEEQDNEICAPAEGELIPMAEIPDPVFSGGAMGECVGILSQDGRIYAPVSGTVSVVAATRHAVSFRSGGTEMLVHVGIDTVKLGGEGFRVHVREGDRVRQGQLVMEADLDLIRAKGLNPMVIAVRLS